MSSLYWYIIDFLRSVDKRLLLFCTCFIGIFIFINYRFGLESRWLYQLPKGWKRGAGFYLIYALAFLVPFGVLLLVKPGRPPVNSWFWALLLLAPALFSLKVNFTFVRDWLQPRYVAPWGSYFSILANLPSRLFILAVPLWLLWRREMPQEPFWGLTTRQFQWQPYLLMLLCMIPLLAFASTRPDFLQVYPKLRQMAFMQDYGQGKWYHKLLYELSYGSDFFTIELFFRGFLVFAFVRYVGPDAILPMAVFYCSIHFGKPLFECISSFFGGLILGVVAYRTGSILGGLMVHLGIAWLMELGGYLGNLWRPEG